MNKKSEFMINKLGMILLILMGLVIALIIIGMMGSKMTAVGQTSFRW